MTRITTMPHHVDDSRESANHEENVVYERVHHFCHLLSSSTNSCGGTYPNSTLTNRKVRTRPNRSLAPHKRTSFARGLSGFGPCCSWLIVDKNIVIMVKIMGYHQYKKIMIMVTALLTVRCCGTMLWRVGDVNLSLLKVSKQCTG